MFFNDDTMVIVDLETVIDNLPVMVLVLDNARRIVLANTKAENFTGWSRNDLAGVRPGEAFLCRYSEEDERGCGFASGCGNCFARKQIKETFETKSNRMVSEGRIISEKNGTLEISLTTTYLAAQDFVLATIEDITELRALERDRIAKDKLQAAMETAGAILHEMNQPLQVISGYMDLLFSSGTAKSSAQDYLPIMREEIHRLISIVGKLRNLRRYRTSEYSAGNEILDLAGSTQD